MPLSFRSAYQKPAGHRCCAEIDSISVGIDMLVFGPGLVDHRVEVVSHASGTTQHDIVVPRCGVQAPLSEPWLGNDRMFVRVLDQRQHFSGPRPSRTRVPPSNAKTALTDLVTLEVLAAVPGLDSTKCHVSASFPKFPCAGSHNSPAAPRLAPGSPQRRPGS